MAGDVRLDERNDWVTVEGSVLHARTADFMLDSPVRRGAGGGALRRALVHDQSDGLTVNFNGDYPGGVTLNGVSYISPKGPKHANGLFARLSLRTVPELTIDGGIQFVWDHGQRVALIGAPTQESVSLQALFEDLQRQIAALTQRVAALEGV